MTYCVITAREGRNRWPPPKPNRPPQAWKAARSFGFAAKPPPPPKNPRRGVVLLPPPELPELREPPPAAGLPPVSLTVVALTVPFEPFAPETTTRSPGLTSFLPTPTFLVTLVARDRVTLTVLPEVSVTSSEFPL